MNQKWENLISLIKKMFWCQQEQKQILNIYSDAGVKGNRKPCKI